MPSDGVGPPTSRLRQHAIGGLANWPVACGSSERHRRRPGCAPALQHPGRRPELGSSAEALRGAWCAAGVTVEWKAYPLAEHLGGIAAGYAAATDFLDDRFDGEAATSTCS